MTTPVTPPAPTVGLREAARICGVSVATVRRRRTALAEHGATSTKAGWVIPVPALIAVGLLDRVSPPDTPSAFAMAPATAPPADTALIAQLRAALVHAEHRAELAEAIAHERGRALAMIEARSAPEQEVRSVAAHQPPAARRWWRRNRQ